MSAKIDTRSGLLLVGIASITACAGHTYGVSVTPTGGTWQAEQYLSGQGFRLSTPERNDVLTMERRHGDSVDHVRIFRGGPAPDLPGWSSSSTAGGIPTGPGGAGIPYRAVATGSPSYGFSPGRAYGTSEKLTLEVAAYRVDHEGRRHGVEPSSRLFDQADSVITLVTLVPSTKRK